MMCQLQGISLKHLIQKRKHVKLRNTFLTKRIDQERNSSSAMSLDDLARQIEEGEVQDINVISGCTGTATVKASMEKIEVWCEGECHP